MVGWRTPRPLAAVGVAAVVPFPVVQPRVRVLSYLILKPLSADIAIAILGCRATIILCSLVAGAIAIVSLGQRAPDNGGFCWRQQRRRAVGARWRRRGRRAGRRALGRRRRALRWLGRRWGGRGAWLRRRVAGRRRRADAFRRGWGGRWRRRRGCQHAETVVGLVAGTCRCLLCVEDDCAAVPCLGATRGRAVVADRREAVAQPFECGTGLQDGKASDAHRLVSIGEFPAGVKRGHGTRPQWLRRRRGEQEGAGWVEAGVAVVPELEAFATDRSMCSDRSMTSGRRTWQSAAAVISEPLSQSARCHAVEGDEGGDGGREERASGSSSIPGQFRGCQRRCESIR